MSIVLENVLSTVTTGGSSITLSVTIPSGLSDSLLVVLVGVNNEDNEVVSGVTFNGSAMTRLGAVGVGNDSISELWYVKNPGAVTANAVATFSGNTANGGVLAAYVFSNVEQSATFGTLLTDLNASGAATLSINLSSAVGDFVLAFCHNDDSGITAGSGQTVDIDQQSNSKSRAVSSHKTATGSSTSMSYTIASGSQGATMIGVAIKPVATLPPIDGSANDNTTVTESIGSSVDLNPSIYN